MSTSRPTDSPSVPAQGGLSSLVVSAVRTDRDKWSRWLREEFARVSEVISAADGRTALEVLRRRTIDFVLLDAQLPDVDCRRWLADLSAGDVQSAVIVLADREDDRLASEVFELGAADCIVKPSLTPRRLRRVVRRALQNLILRQQNTRMERQVQRAHDELNHFVRALSHDMNANFMLLEHSFARLKDSLDEEPLAKEPLAKEPVPPQPAPQAQQTELRDYVCHVEACLRESKRFLDDLVHLGKTGAVDMESSPVDLAGVVDEVLFEQGALLADRKAEVVVERPLDTIWCNRGRLKQIVTNLVRNAVTHGGASRNPRIIISSATTHDDTGDASTRGTAWLRIHDNGPGIDRRFRKEVFLPGRRLPQTVCDGSGMGLAIVKKIVEYYGGSVELDPDCTAGTAFLVAIPFPQQSPSPTSDGKTPEDQAADGADAGNRWSLQHDGPHQTSRPSPHHSVRNETHRSGRSSG